MCTFGFFQRRMNYKSLHFTDMPHKTIHKGVDEIIGIFAELHIEDKNARKLSAYMLTEIGYQLVGDLVADTVRHIITRREIANKRYKDVPDYDRKLIAHAKTIIDYLCKRSGNGIHLNEKIVTSWSEIMFQQMRIMLAGEHIHDHHDAIRNKRQPN